MFSGFEKWKLNAPQVDLLKMEGVETVASGTNFIQSTLAKATANPWAVVIPLFVLGMIFNKKGGIELGKFKVRV